MAAFQSRNQSQNNQAQMLLLMSQVKNLESRISQLSQLDNSVDGSQNLINQLQLKLLQNNIANTKPAWSKPQSSVPDRRKAGNIKNKVPVKPMSNGLDLSGILSAGLQALTGPTDERGRCVWVTKLPEEFRDADFLCNVFGCYGNVQRIKFSDKKPDGALIELGDVRCATKAARCLNNFNLGEEKIVVRAVRVGRIKGTFDGVKSKDYSKARIGRYPKEGRFTAICMKRASRPTAIVLVSKIPKGKLPELKKYITKSGFAVKGVEETKVHEDRKGKKPGQDYCTPVMIELASPEEALKAIGKLHNTMPSNIGEMNGNRGLVFSMTNRTDLQIKA